MHEGNDAHQNKGALEDEREELEKEAEGNEDEHTHEGVVQVEEFYFVACADRCASVRLRLFADEVGLTVGDASFVRAPA